MNTDIIGKAPASVKALWRAEQTGHLRYVKSAVDFWYGKLDAVPIKRAYRRTRGA